MLLVEDYGKDLSSVEALIRRHEEVERDLTVIEDKLGVSIEGLGVHAPIIVGLGVHAPIIEGLGVHAPIIEGAGCTCSHH